MTNVSCFFDEASCILFGRILGLTWWITQFLGAAMLLISVLALTDRFNGPPPAGLVPMGLFFLILGIGASLGFQTGK